MNTDVSHTRIGYWAVIGAASASVVLALAACGSGGSAFPTSHCLSGCVASPTPITSVPPGPKIQHVVIIVQENRSFDNLFNGYPGADTVRVGKNHLGQNVPLQALPLDQRCDVDHSNHSFSIEYDNGKLDGWDVTQHTCATPLAYTRQSDVVPYWTLAQQYTLADRMFQSNNGPSFGAHQFLIAGQLNWPDTNPHDNFAWGCDSQVPNPPCFDIPTLGDILDTAGLSWKYYSEGDVHDPIHITGWQAYDAIKHIRYGPDWMNGRIATPETSIFADISTHKLPAVTWIVPTNPNSDHAGPFADNGPAWVASLVNAIGQSSYWSTTAIFVTWDDWGGWYDHVSPPQLYKDGLGFRVPLLVISPYAKAGYVSHVQHEFGSILHFTETRFGLPSLGTADARSDDLLDCFDFNQAPRPFRIVPAAMKAEDFLRQPAPIDDTPDY